MDSSGDFLTGVIEGFYGRPWSFATRAAYAGYLARAGLNTYLYCPKADPYLRRRWREPWPDETREQMCALGTTLAAAGLQWGVGLSPFELYLDYGPRERDALQRKIEELGSLEAPLLAVLFDDMPGDVADLARRQGDIVADIRHWLPQTRLLVCPTYYSFDPVLERHFGSMPRGYWQELGRSLPAEVDIFWTGNEVCAASIRSNDVGRIAGLLGRSVMLWDNYPVNDGAVRSRFLYTRPLEARDPALRPYLSGHLCNPMNQALLSLPALAGLATLYDAPGLDDDVLGQILGEDVWQRLRQDGPAFQEQGLDGLGPQRCAKLADIYAGMAGQAAAEVAGWLRGEYRFDSACLTD